ncbi:MAG: hypothetical protein NZ700_16055 [Gemmataceae bacterium]|nr:hypothetical protein [Gemmataceae bacterium]MDW8264152.1 hypothetical protein [Gemmataceae bacterium]
MRCLPIVVGSVLGLVIGLTAAPPAADTGGKPVNLAKLNTEKDEDEPHVASNNLMLLYSLRSKGKWDLMVSRRATTSQPWPPGRPVEEVNRKTADSLGAFLTPEGVFPQRLYYASNKDIEMPDKVGDNFDIYFLSRQFPNSDFTFEQGLPFLTAADELHPWVTPEGHFYFSRRTKEGWRVFVALVPKGGGALQAPKPVELPVGFHHATLTPNGTTMYLQGPLEKDRWGLFRSDLVGGTWSKPVPLTGLNSEEGKIGDRSPCLSRDGALLYFASDRPGGKGGLDLWVVPTASLKK